MEELFNLKYFQNPYKDLVYNVVVKDTLEIVPYLKDLFVIKVKSLLDKLGQEMSHDYDWSDYTVFTGVSGITLLHLQLAPVLGKDHLSKAECCIEKVLTDLKREKVSFLKGDAGPLAIGTIVYDQLEKYKDRDFILKKLLMLREDALLKTEDDLISGKAGYLYSLLYVVNYLGKAAVPQELIRSLIEAILKSGQECANKCRFSQSPLMFELESFKFLGAAHGMAGILYVLMEARSYLDPNELKNLVRPSVDYFLTIQMRSGNFPTVAGFFVDKTLHWCHGASGVVHLFSIAFEAFSDEKYLMAAKKCADLVWEKGLLKKSYGLYKGVAGNGYTFLRMFQATKDTEYLFRAIKFAEWCTEYETHGYDDPEHPASLFEGLAGIIYFLSDILEPEKATFPGFQISTTI